MQNKTINAKYKLKLNMSFLNSMLIINKLMSFIFPCDDMHNIFLVIARRQKSF